MSFNENVIIKYILCQEWPTNLKYDKKSIDIIYFEKLIKVYLKAHPTSYIISLKLHKWIKATALLFHDITNLL